MKVIVVTHGQHQKGGTRAENYDGPLTEESIRKVRRIRIPGVDAIFCGTMRRHRETAEAMGVNNATQTKKCGWDKSMFGMLEGDKEPVSEFWEWLQGLKDEGHESLLIITSRGYAIMLRYLIDVVRKDSGHLVTF
jgi:broad specificity phosphatase PhoE